MTKILRSLGIVLALLATGLPTGSSAATRDGIAMAAASRAFTEGDGAQTITVTRVGSTGAASVNYGFTNGTAQNGTHYVGTPGTLNWNAGETGAKTIPVTIIDDGAPNASRTFTVTLSGATGTPLMAPMSTMVTIADNFNQVQFSAPTANVTEGTATLSLAVTRTGFTAGTTVTVNDDDKGVRFASPTYDVFENGASVLLQVQRIGPATAPATATYATVNGSAVSGTDFGMAGYTQARTGSLSWIAGDAATKTITIPILNNAIPGQPDRTFTVNLTPGAGLVLGTPGTATVTIHDDDIPAQSNVQFSQPKYIVMENGGNAVLTVQRVDAGGGFGLPATVSFATMAVTAVATTDYTTKTGTLTWAAGDSADKTISVPIVNNTVAEPTKLFKVVLSKASPGVGIPAPEGFVAILDDDEVFPKAGAMPAGFSTPVSTTAGWHVSNDPSAYEGVFSLKSDEIDDSQSAGLQMSGTFAGGNVIFYVKVSSEAGFDTLQFFIDDVLQTTWSGTATAGWQTSPTYPLTAGVHTLKWVYAKDASVSVGADAVWLDGLKTPTFTP